MCTGHSTAQPKADLCSTEYKLYTVQSKMANQHCHCTSVPQGCMVKLCTHQGCLIHHLHPQIIPKVWYSAVLCIPQDGSTFLTTQVYIFQTNAVTLKRAVLQRSGTPGTPSLQLGLFKAIYEHHFKNTFSKVKVQLTRWSQQQKNYNFYGNIFVVILIIPITMQNLCHGTRHHCARNTKQKDSL